MATQTTYHFAIGRRKASTATVRLYEGKGVSMIGDKKIDEVYHSLDAQKRLYMPLEVLGLKKKMYFTAKASGGGINGQLDAIKLGIARALVKISEDNKPELKKHGLLTRDSRIVERKKTGKRKARKSVQFSKR